MSQSKSFGKGGNALVILIRGVPGSGKTLLAAKLAKAFQKERVVMLDPDAIDYKSEAYLEHVKAATKDGVDPSLFPYRFLRSQAYQGVADHKLVIWNQPFTNLEIFKKMTSRLENCAAENYTKLAILVVEVNVDLATAKKRISRRIRAGGHGPSEGRMARFYEEYKSYASEGYSVISVDGAGSPSKSVTRVMKAIDEL